ncbi:MAG: septum formation initiator family protein [Planctomycetes bacterium]|nr:septum formation initiator family protein [Planctomycetota bacterium]
MEEILTTTRPTFRARCRARLAALGWLLRTILAGLLLFAPGAAAIGLSLYGPEAERRLDVERQTAAVQAEVNILAQLRDQLAAVEKALQDDPQYLERTVRYELGLVRPGEMRLPQKVKLAPAARAAAQGGPAELPTAMEVVALFGNDHLRFIALVTGIALLAAAVIVSLPARRPAGQPA